MNHSFSKTFATQPWTTGTCLLLLYIVILVSCQRRVEIREILDDAGNVLERFEVERETNLKNGLYERFSDGVTVEQIQYRNDTIHGFRKLFYPSGTLEVLETYAHGTFHGLYQTFHENEQVEQDGQYHHGRMEGPWKKYYPSGQLMEIVEMHDNEENGPFVEYHENGHLKAEGNYLHGDNEHGILKLYDENGQLERTMQCNEGVCYTIAEPSE